MISLSLLAQERRDLVAFREASPETLEIPESPSFIFGTFPDRLASFYYGHTSLHRIGVFSTRSLTLRGSLALSYEEKLLHCGEANIHPLHVAQVANDIAKWSGNRQLRRIDGQAVLLEGPGYQVYGHWLVDFLPKLYILHSCGYEIGDLKFIVPRDTPSFGFDWLRLLGIEERQVELIDPNHEDVIADAILVPTTLHNGVRASTLLRPTSRFLLRRIEASHRLSLPNSVHSKILISRRNGPQSRPLANRKEIEKIASDSGFLVVHPEHLSIPEQVAIFHNATEIIGEYGSGMHGSLFAGPGAVIMALRGTEFHPAFIQSGMGHVLHQPTGYVFGSMIGEAGAFEIDLDAFRDAISAVTILAQRAQCTPVSRAKSQLQETSLSYSGREDEVDAALRSWAWREVAPWAVRRTPGSNSHLKGGEFDEGPADALGSLCRVRFSSGRATSIAVSSVEVQANPLANQEAFRERKKLYLSFLNSVASEYGIDINTEMLVDVCDGRAANDKVPIFCFQKTTTSRHILIPDVDFIGCNEYFESYIDRIPYDEKVNSAIFVGATTGSLGFGHSGSLLSLEGVQRLAIPRLRSWAAFRASSHVIFKLPELMEIDGEETREALLKLGLGGPRISWEDQLRYKFILSMDGDGATCSRVAIALRSNSVLLKYDSPYDLFYFAGLRPWVHYVPIRDDRDVEDVVAEERKSPGLFRGIAEKGREFALTFLTRNSIKRYTAFLLEMYASVIGDQDWSPVRSKIINRQPALQILAHLRNYGDRHIEATAGKPMAWVGADGCWIEGLCITTSPELTAFGLQYDVILEDGTTSDRLNEGDYAGTRGQGKPIFGFCISLRSGLPNGLTAWYAARFIDGSVVGPIPFGAVCASPSGSALAFFGVELREEPSDTPPHSASLC